MQCPNLLLVDGIILRAGGTASVWLVRDLGSTRRADKASIEFTLRHLLQLHALAVYVYLTLHSKPHAWSSRNSPAGCHREP